MHQTKQLFHKHPSDTRSRDVQRDMKRQVGHNHLISNKHYRV